MKITGKYKPYANGKTVGFLNLNLDDLVYLNFAVIMNNGQGLWIAKPQKKVKDDYKDIYFFKKEISEAILEQLGDGTQEVEIEIYTEGEPVQSSESEDDDEFPF